MVKSRLKPKKNDFKSKNPESTRPNTLNLSGKRGTYIKSIPFLFSPLPYGRGQWSKGRISLPTTLIPAAANRETVWPVVVAAVDGTVVAEQGAVPGIGPGQDGGGPPTAVVGHVVEISVEVPTAARQGREARRIRGPRIRRIPATRGGLSCCALQ